MSVQSWIFSNWFYLAFVFGTVLPGTQKQTVIGDELFFAADLDPYRPACMGLMAWSGAWIPTCPMHSDMWFFLQFFALMRSDGA